MEELVRYMKAMVMLQVRVAELLADKEDGVSVRPELLLAEAGFGAREIAGMLGKSQAAVAKSISRARSARRSESADAPTQMSEGV